MYLEWRKNRAAGIVYFQEIKKVVADCTSLWYTWTKTREEDTYPLELEQSIVAGEAV